MVMIEVLGEIAWEPVELLLRNLLAQLGDILEHVEWLLRLSLWSCLLRPVRGLSCGDHRADSIAGGAARQSLRSASAMRLMLAAMYPAPKPLSMFTTATPPAQLFSIARSGARPPKLAP